ncbi:MAG TPA: Smr/MutS family protein [Kofleriaceae bacterium]|nr:Smr/MutS family protein [Kofleriaceae bacterium]
MGEPVRRDADGELFRDAVRGATPLADRRRVAVPGRSAAGGRTVARPADRDPATSDDGALHMDMSGGRAPGVSRKTLRELAAGRPRCEATLDLHRHTSRIARERLARFVAESRAAGLRAILVITGKAERSPGPERLRDLVPEWLSGPLAPSILAFTVARAEHGGAGALYVLLRTPSP